MKSKLAPADRQLEVGNGNREVKPATLPFPSGMETVKLWEHLSARDKTSKGRNITKELR